MDRFHRIQIPSNEEIFRAGDVGNCAYLIAEGQVEIVNPHNGKILSVIGPGELIGEIALIDQQPRTATARARSATTLIEIHRSLVAELLAGADPLIRHLLHVILRRFRRTLAGEIYTGGLADKAPDPMVSITATDNLRLLKDMAVALLENQFDLYYQPIVALSDRRICGFEALIRWRHPEYGLLNPTEFLPLAEETGLIRPIGLWTLRQACADWPALRTLVTHQTPFISVNVSAKQLTDPAFADDVLGILRLFEVNPAEIKLELTETTLIRNADMARSLMQQVVAGGVSLALDDFGTGYGGLEHLQNYPFSTLKLDQSFVGKLVDSELSRELVHGSITLSKPLRLATVAEGIETAAVAMTLETMGCDFAQGFYFARPMPRDGIMRLAAGCTLPAPGVH